MDQGHSAQTVSALYLGDTGKANVKRRWGYYDDEEGAWFELDGTTLYIVVKISHLGGYEYRIPQSQWNGDRVNGEGGQRNLSRFNLDLTKTNLYSIQWQNAVGYIFFRVITDTGIVTCHVFPMLNYFTGTNTGRHTMELPMRWEQYNSGISVSTSENNALQRERRDRSGWNRNLEAMNVAITSNWYALTVYGLML